MNKNKMGSFLKSLRDEKKMTQQDLANILKSKYLTISSKAISDWENGKTIPEIENLREIAEVYNVSIDEILDGERKQDIDFSKKYFITDEHWISNYIGNTYIANQEQINLVIDTFNKLLHYRVKNDFTINEEREFRFLFENFYNLSEYCVSEFKYDKKDEYLFLKNVIKKVLFQITNMDDEEKIWELKKLIMPKKELLFNINTISNQCPKLEGDTDKKFKKLEFWQKDILLMCFQVYDFVTVDEASYGSNHLKEYEERTGHEFNKEQITKDILKYMIKNGARLNNHYLNFIKRKTVQRRIIDRVEELYHLCKEPIKGEVYNEDNPSEPLKYSAENNSKNRFIHNCYYDLITTFDYSLEELYELVSNNDEFTRDMLINAAKKDNIDINREDKYIFSDLSWRIRYAKEKFDEYKTKEKEIAEGLDEYDKLLAKLNAGEIYEPVTVDEFCGGKNCDDLIDYCYFWNQFTTRDELIRLRKNPKTEELLKEIDLLSLDEIRNKYFAPEVRYE